MSLPPKQDETEVLKAVCGLRDCLVSLSHNGKLSDRRRAIRGLLQVIVFLERVYRHPGLSIPFTKLLNSLLDLERGVVAPMLQKDRRSNINPIGRDPIERINMRAMSAATISKVPVSPRTNTSL